MFGFEIRCIHKGRTYSEWAVVQPPWAVAEHLGRPRVGGKRLPRYRRLWIVERDPDRGSIPGGQFGLWIEQVFGGLVPDGGWWLWARISRPTETYRLAAEWA